MRIAVIGLGYVGCVAVAKLCAAGHEVLGVDVNESKVALVNRGKPTIIEPGLDELFATARKSGNLRATASLKEAAVQSDVLYLCVGTPLKPDGDLDLGSIFHVADEIEAALVKGGPRKVLIMRSTVKPGTSAVLLKKLQDRNVSIVMNPEFLREGSAIEDWDAPGLVVIGAFDDHGRHIAKQLHDNITGQVFYVRPETAEVIKYINNSWHALKVAFGNEIGRLSDGFNIDHEELMDVFLADKKLNISGYYLRPGMPYGGSCLPKDLSALTVFARQQGLPVPVLEAVAKSNDRHIGHIVDMVCRYGKTKVGVLGLSFKRDTDDLRNSPSIEIVRSLVKRGVALYIFDQNVQLDQLSGQNREQVLDLFAVLQEAMMPTLEAMIAQVDLIIVTHDMRSSMAGLRRRYPGKIFLEMFRFKAEGA